MEKIDTPFLTYVPTIENEADKRRFYKSARWLKCRERVLKRDNYECVLCRKKGRHVRAQEVHHIKHLDKNPELALVEDNLISLCKECHNNQHRDTFGNNSYIEKVALAEENFPERW